MKKLNLRTKNHRQYIEVPVDFIDEYMPQAPECAVKIYLYLQRCACDSSILLSLSDMADLFDVTQKTVIRSLTYWEECGLMTLEYNQDELTDITLLPLEDRPDSDAPAAEGSVSSRDTGAVSALSAEEDQAPANIQALPVRESAAPASAPSGTLSPAASMDLERDEGFTDLLDLVQAYQKKPVTSTMRDALGYCYLLFDRKSDVIEYLIEYCLDQGHFSVNYIRTVADNWAAEGLKELSDIKAAKAGRSKVVTGVQSAFGIRDRALGTAEMDYITRWSRDFDLPIILEACNRTIRNSHSPSFSYADKILSDWKDEKVASLEDVRRLDEEHAKKDNQPASPSGNGKKSGTARNFTEREEDYSDLIKKYYES